MISEFGFINEVLFCGRCTFNLMQKIQLFQVILKFKNTYHQTKPLLKDFADHNIAEGHTKHQNKYENTVLLFNMINAISPNTKQQPTQYTVRQSTGDKK